MGKTTGRQHQATGDQITAFLPRMVLGSILLTAVCFPSLYQPCLSSLYQYLYQSSFYRLSTFETILTVTCYAIFEPLYTYKFGHNPDLRIDIRNKAKADGDLRPRLPKMKRPQHRLFEAVTYTAPLLFLDLIMIKKFAGVPINDIRRSGGFAAIDGADISLVDILARNASLVHNGTFVSSSFLLPSVHNFSLSSPLQLERALPPVAPSSRRLVLELATAFFIYDALFFAIHVAFHKVKALARFHNPHHTHAEMHPQVTNRLSVVERLSLVMLANFALNIIGSHVVTRTMFVPLFVYLLIEVHCGMDLDWGYNKILPAGWGAGPTEHAKHHRTGSGTYAPFFTWWDILLDCVTSAPDSDVR